MSDYKSREDMDMTVEDIHGTMWGVIHDGIVKNYYMRVWDRPDGWVFLAPQKVRQLPSSILDSLDDPSDEMVEIHGGLRGENPDFVTISEEQFDALQPGQRIWMTVSSGWGEAAEKEFEVGRSSYSKKYDVRSKRLYPIRDGEPHKQGVKWTLLKRGTGRVGLAHGDMAAMVKSFRVGTGKPSKPSGTALVLSPVKEGPQSYSLKIDGTVGRTAVRGYTAAVPIGLYVGSELPRNYTITVNKAEGGKLGFATQRKVEDAVRLKFEELRDQVAEELRVERRDRSANPAPTSASGLVGRLKF